MVTARMSGPLGLSQVMLAYNASKMSASSSSVAFVTRGRRSGRASSRARRRRDVSGGGAQFLDVGGGEHDDWMVGVLVLLKSQRLTIQGALGPL